MEAGGQRRAAAAAEGHKAVAGGCARRAIWHWPQADRGSRASKGDGSGHAQLELQVALECGSSQSPLCLDHAIRDGLAVL